MCQSMDIFVRCHTGDELPIVLARNSSPRTQGGKHTMDDQQWLEEYSRC